MIVNILLYPFLTFSASNISERRFISQTKHFKNQWEYGGYTIYDSAKNRFEFVPGDRYSDGFVWFLNRLSRNNWSVRADFEFYLDSKLNNFGVWINSRFGSNGEIFGGPSSFSGIAVLFKFSLGKLEIEIRQNNGSESFKPVIFLPKFSKELRYPEISLNISYFSNETLKIFLNNEKDFLLFNEKPKVSLSHFWLGITSYNPKDGKPLYLNKIKIKGLKNQFKGKNPKRHKTSDSTLSILNSTQNQKLISAIKLIKEENDYFQFKRFHNKFNFEDIIEFIEILVNYSNKMLKQKMLTRVTREQMMQFADCWQRRSLSSTKSANILRETVKDEMSMIEQEVYSLGYSIQSLIRKFHRDLNDITNELIFSYEKMMLHKEDIDEIDGNYLRLFFLYFCAFEIFLLLIFFYVKF